MKPDARFLGQPKTFWANVRFASEKGGYTKRGAGEIRSLSLAEVVEIYHKFSLQTDHITPDGDSLTPMGVLLLDYFQSRARRLNTEVEPNLMDAKSARAVFEEQVELLQPRCPIPMNKQKGDKKAPAYLTGLVNMLVEANANGLPCDYDPRQLTTVTVDGRLNRTFARRLDGAFPQTVNPVAVWEVKEYYYTTTFGSRVADGVYESLLDGMELEELRQSESIHIGHYLMVDAHYTWWDCGRSYLCRMFDMLHMGYVDEILFGYEVVERLPALVRDWVRAARARGLNGPQ